MIRRPTWILVLVFAGLAALVWLVPLWQERNPKPTPTAQVTPSPVFEAGTITWMTLQDSTGKAIVVEKTAGNSPWTVKQPADQVFEPTQVQSAMTGLEGASIQTSLTQQPPQGAMGLDKPAYTITLMLKDGAERIIKVGNATPTGSGYYTQIGSEPAFVMSKSSLDPVLQLLTAGKPLETPVSGTPQTGLPGTPGVGNTPPAVAGTPTP